MLRMKKLLGLGATYGITPLLLKDIAWLLWLSSLWPQCEKCMLLCDHWSKLKVTVASTLLFSLAEWGGGGRQRVPMHQAQYYRTMLMHRRKLRHRRMLMHIEDADAQEGADASTWLA